jgi:hypothetical protein
MALTYGDVRTWNADLVDEAGNTVRQRKDALLAFEDDLDASGVPSFWQWRGEAASRARGTVRRLVDRATDLVAEVSAVQRALYEASDGILTLQNQVAEAEALARANQFAIAADGAVVDNAAPLPDPQSPAIAREYAEVQRYRSQISGELAESIVRIMTRAGEIDQGLAEVMGLAAAGEISDGGVTSLAEADLSEVTEDGHYQIGPPETPEIERDDDFEYNSKDSSPGDFIKKAEWLAKLRAAQLGMPHLDDATAFYEHYWDNDGEPREWDYEEAHSEDSGIRAGVDAEIARAQAAAEELIRNGHTDFPMTGQATNVAGEHYPVTENWQKAVGGYQVWSSSDVRVDGNTVTMEITVHGEDRYNFNRGESDIATGTADEENGRFTEIGWAQPFDTSGELTRTVTWQLGDAGDADVSSPPADGGREPPRGERDRGSTPDNPRERGR